MAKYELIPTDQKSFHGKAHVIVSEMGQTLLSYDTTILKIDWNFEVIDFSKVEWHYSRTTMKHVNAFLRSNNMQETNLNRVRLSIENGEWHDGF